MTEQDNEYERENNPFNFISHLSRAFDHPFVTSRVTFSRLSVIFGIVFGLGGMGVIVNNLIGSPLAQIPKTATKKVQEIKIEPTSEKIKTDFLKPPQTEIDNYEEISINMDFACSTEKMKKEARNQLKVGINEDLKIQTKLSDKTHLWPVYRWKCLYEKSQTTSAIVSLGLDLETYCKEARGKEFNYGYKNYLDPNSFYCTRINNDVISNGGGK